MASETCMLLIKGQASMPYALSAHEGIPQVVQTTTIDIPIRETL